MTSQKEDSMRMLLRRMTRLAFVLIMTLTLVAGTVISASAVPATSAEENGDNAVDVFIGDSSMAAASKTQRWTTILAQQDHSTSIDESVSGAGFITGQTFATQNDRALQTLDRDSLNTADVKRVFVDGGINDLSTLQKDPAKIPQFISIVKDTLQKIKDSYPNAQLLFSPSIGVKNPTTEEIVKKVDIYLTQLNEGAAKMGYHTKTPWSFMAGDDPDYKLVYSKTNMHMNAAGHKQAAEKIIAWINTLDGPKIGESSTDRISLGAVSSATSSSHTHAASIVVATTALVIVITMTSILIILKQHHRNGMHKKHTRNREHK